LTSCSMELIYSDRDSRELEPVVKDFVNRILSKASQKGNHIFLAAGNEVGATLPKWPYEIIFHPAVTIVGSVNHQNQLSTFSPYKHIGLFHYGENVDSISFIQSEGTTLTPIRRRRDGTSQATAKLSAETVTVMFLRRSSDSYEIVRDCIDSSNHKVADYPEFRS